MPRLTRKDLECEFYREFRELAKAFDRAFPKKVEEYEVWIRNENEELAYKIKELIEAGVEPKEAIEKVLGTEVVSATTKDLGTYSFTVYRCANGRKVKVANVKGRLLVKVTW